MSTNLLPFQLQDGSNTRKELVATFPMTVHVFLRVPMCGWSSQTLSHKVVLLGL